ncbi:iron reductase domain protein [Bipolaris zeicola 26-R-13]|uniref:Iron reductase domain protein n=1 Tax=Cochliobolus carbonum (strain 26-R-13) TaxID=930089 RepID=W6Y7X5_COCC2|nr:iron reductase domain protein [Bipolaris zeicola 26-R-13]EUC34053.1 iron reductase domain protein [Bipolaris zeicola 26-R-13]
MRGFSRASAFGLTALASLVSAQVASVCPSTGVCYKLNIPQNTASSGSGDIFFQIQAPSNYEWVALGQGSGMANSNMFVVYTSASGNNVTLSPRHTTSYSPPTFNSDAQVTLLEGSGVSNGVMTANVKCSNCNSWSGGTMDFKSGSGNWIYAFQNSGGPLNIDDTSAQINQHSGHSAFNWDFAQAKGGSSVNPLIATTSTGTTPSNGNGNGNGNTNSGITTIRPSGAVTNRREKLIAHGVLSSLAFVIFFPTGGIAIRLVSMTGMVWIHAAFQIFGYMTYIAGAGLGIHLACGLKRTGHYHAIIGMILLGVLFFMPILGYMHHLFFKKVQNRTIWSHAHIWVGRIFITLGILNGGFGLKLADCSNLSSRAGQIVYGIVAGLIWFAWVGAIVIGEKKRSSSLSQSGSKLADERANSDGTAVDVNGHYGHKQQQ